MKESTINEVRQLKEKFADIKTLCDGSEMLDTMKSRIAQVLGIIATHVGAPLRVDLPSVKGHNGYKFYIEFMPGQRSAHIFYHQPGGFDWSGEVSAKDATDWRSSLPIFLVVPLVKDLPFALTEALRASTSLKKFFEVCGEVIELKEASRRVEGEEG